MEPNTEELNELYLFNRVNQKRKEASYASVHVQYHCVFHSNVVNYFMKGGLNSIIPTTTRFEWWQICSREWKQVYGMVTSEKS